MPTFGFSAYLKLVCLSERRQRSEVRKRLFPKGQPYDYHKSLRRCARKLLIDNLPIPDVFGIADGITKPAERNSVKIGLAAIEKWRSANPGDLELDKPQTTESPSKIFSIKFVPDFKIKMHGEILSIHLWNTKNPLLILREARGAMSLFQWFYPDLAVLNLQNDTVIKLSDAEDHLSIGRARMLQIESVFQRVIEEIDSDSVRSERPAAPPAPPFG